MGCCWTLSWLYRYEMAWHRDQHHHHHSSFFSVNNFQVFFSYDIGSPIEADVTRRVHHRLSTRPPHIDLTSVRRGGRYLHWAGCGHGRTALVRCSGIVLLERRRDQDNQHTTIFRTWPFRGFQGTGSAWRGENRRDGWEWPSWPIGFLSRPQATRRQSFLALL